MLWHLHDDVHPGFLQKLIIELLCITVEHHILVSLIFTPLQDVLLLFRNDTSLPQFVAIIRSSASEIGNHTAFEHFHILLSQFVEHFSRPYAILTRCICMKCSHLPFLYASGKRHNHPSCQHSCRRQIIDGHIHWQEDIVH